MDQSTLGIISTIIAFVIGIVVHESSHALVAYFQGDMTAKNKGRLTLNPLAHIDIFGTILIPLILLILRAPVIGWAKPVPVNPYNFRNQKYGHLLVSLAGPFSNLVIIAFFSILLKTLLGLGVIAPNSGLILLFGIIIMINTWLMIFNLMPIPPLDGSEILFTFLPDRYEKIRIILTHYGIWILILLLFFGFFQYILSFLSFLVFHLFGVADIIMGIF